MCHTYNFYLIIIRFLDPENIGVDAKIAFLGGLQAKISSKTQFYNCHMAILFWPLNFFSSRMPSWHPPDSDSGMVQDDESTIKVHNNAKTRFSWIWPFGSWTTCIIEVVESFYVEPPTQPHTTHPFNMTTCFRSAPR